MTEPVRAPGGDAEPPPSDALFIMGVISTLFGVLLLLGALFLWISQPGAAEGAAGGGAVFENSYLVAALGAGLFVLGAVLVAPDVLDRLQQRRGLHALNAVALSGLALALVVLLNYVFARHNLFRLDLTSDGLYSLSEESVQLVKHLERDVKLVVFLPATRQSELQTIQTLMDQYRSASPRIQVERVDPNALEPRQLQLKLEDLGLSGQGRDWNDLLGIVVQSGYTGDAGWQSDRSKHVPFTELWEAAADPTGQRGGSQTFTGERAVSSAIMEVTGGTKPRLYFLVGHGEASITNFDPRGGLSELSQLLRQKDFETAELDLMKGEGGGPPKIPDDADLLVVPGPTKALTDAEVAAVRAYLDRGGDALLMLEPNFDRRRRPPGYVPTGLEAIAAGLGVQALEREILSIGVDMFGRRVLASQAMGYELDPAHPATAPIARQGARLMFFGARPLQVAPGQEEGGAKALVKTPGETAFAAADAAAVLRDPSRLDELDRGPFTLVVAVEKKRPAPAPPAGAEAPASPPEGPRTRVVVVGDAEWASNENLFTPQAANLELFLNAVNWAIEREHRVVGRAVRPKSYRLDMTKAQARFFQLASLFGMPALGITFGVFVWVLRRR